MFRIQSILPVLVIFTLYLGEVFAQTDRSGLTILPTRPADTSFTDLKKIRHIFEGKRIVLLGEQAHSEGSVFQEKVRLIKFLHRELGYTILAFESGLLDCYMSLEDAKSENSIAPMQEAVLGIWSDTRELTELFNYILTTQQTAHPLRLVGFDDLSSGRYRDAFWTGLQQEAGLSSAEKDVIEPVLYGTAEHLRAEQDASEFLQLLAQIHGRMPEGTESQRMLKMAFKLWSRSVEWQLDELQGEGIPVQNPRDQWMAEAMSFLAEEYSDEKIIGWGASYHFADQVGEYENTKLTREYARKMQEMDHDPDPFDLDSALYGAIPMGHILKERFGDDLFSLAFTAWEGSYQFLEEDTISFLTPPEGSLEQVIFPEAENAIVTFRNDSAWFYSSALGHLPIYANWPQIFDGIYYMRDLYPPTHISYKEEVRMSDRKDEGKLYGRIIDAETLQPVPYASVQVLNTARGVASNATGAFEIAIDGTRDGLIVSSIGYESDTIMTGEINQKSDYLVRLTPRTFLLSEVTIRDRALTAREILKRAKEALENNFSNSPYNQELYYSMIGRHQDSVYFNEQASVLMYFPDGYQPKKDVFGKILQYRHKENYTHRHSGIGALWLLFSHDLVLDKDNVLFRTNAYELQIEKVLVYQDRLVYDIAFTCIRPTAFTTGYGYPAPEAASGHIYIATDDFAVLKFDLCVERQSYSPKKEPHITQHPRHHHLSQSYLRHAGSYYLQHSFTEMEVTTTNAETGKSVYSVQHQYLTSMDILTDELVEINRPVIKLNSGNKVKTDPSFYMRHGYVVDQAQAHDFYCGVSAADPAK